MDTIALVNQKGGVGKSTTAVNLSAGLARLGKRVLVIDLDPQAHSTVAFGLDPRKLETTVYSLLTGAARAKEVIRPVSEGLWLIPANIHLAGGEAELASMPNPSLVLKQAMARVDASDYDFAIVDSPPQLGFLNVNSLAWVRDVFIPLTCEFYALHGLSLLMETVERVKAKLNPDLRISGVLPCMVHPRRAVTRDVLAELERHLPGRLFKTRIRVNVRLVEAPSHGKSIFDYAPDSNGAADYMSLAKEVLERMPTLADRTEASAPAPEPEGVAPMEPAIEAVVAPTPEAEAAAPGEPAPEPVAAASEPEVAAPTEPAVEAVSAAPTSELEAPAAVEPPTEVPAAEPVAVAPEPVQEAVVPPDSKFVDLPPGVPLTTPVGAPVPAPAPSAVASTTPYAQMLGLSGLKPIVVARPGGNATPPPVKAKGFGSRLLGKLMGRKD